MAKPVTSKLFARLMRDKAYRRRFAANPAEVLREAGYDPELLDLPTQMDAAELDAQLARVKAGSFDFTGTQDEWDTLSADDLWRRFAMIRHKPAATSTSVVTVVGDPPAAAVVYGTTAVHLVTVAVAGNEGGLRSKAQARLLQGLAKKNENEITFSVTGPDGVSVEDLSPRALEAFLRLLK